MVDVALAGQEATPLFGSGSEQGADDELAGVAHISMKATSVAGMERRVWNGMRE